ncbi:MAG: hypothetical protein GY930_08200, partial [bacterium]|nr:hypothetical protein [bacterium]
MVLPADVWFPFRRKNNPRLVVTNLRNKPKRVYENYCGRANTENRNKELKNVLSIARTTPSSTY